MRAKVKVIMVDVEDKDKDSLSQLAQDVKQNLPGTAA
jgi:hypothetical protein